MVSVVSTRTLRRLSFKGKKAIVWSLVRCHSSRLLVVIRIANPGSTASSLIAHLSIDINIELLKTAIKIHLK